VVAVLSAPLVAPQVASAEADAGTSQSDIVNWIEGGTVSKLNQIPEIRSEIAKAIRGAQSARMEAGMQDWEGNI
jgi:hypothetical protein